ncbi:hypothetical protein L873DRAFT_622698 [Choiromyces venosus 120613-1]|uniref:Uncharacterized protein n=1 Tax=Choiromyces venosus 120613-1 TaxID=1336337 RepID=A0A3N4IX97_9PEZI|nr:hypothetical protein L873DRAFT_622698 [Choiromyces venosus 120613-1]
MTCRLHGWYVAGPTITILLLYSSRYMIGIPTPDLQNQPARGTHTERAASSLRISCPRDTCATHN